MVWTGNLFENNTARSGSAGMELNQCSGDIRQSSFFKNRVSFREVSMTCFSRTCCRSAGACLIMGTSGDRKCFC